MVLALLTILGRQYRLRLVLEEVRPSIAPPTFDTTLEAVEPSGPGLAKTLPPAALRLVRSTEAA